MYKREGLPDVQARRMELKSKESLIGSLLEYVKRHPTKESASNRGELLGLACAWRSATTFDKAAFDADELRKIFQQHGMDVVIGTENGAIVERTAFIKRAEQESDFVRSLGWSVGMSLEDFVASVPSLDHQDALSNKQTGLLNGFPRASIEGYVKREEVYKKLGVGSLLLESTVDGPGWTEAEQAILRRVQKQLMLPVKFNQPNEAREQYAAKQAGLERLHESLLKVLRSKADVGVDDVRAITAHQPVVIFTPAAYFPVIGYGAYTPADFEAGLQLRERVISDCDVIGW